MIFFSISITHALRDRLICKARFLIATRDGKEVQALSPMFPKANTDDEDDSGRKDQISIEDCNVDPSMGLSLQIASCMVVVGLETKAEICDRREQRCSKKFLTGEDISGNQLRKDSMRKCSDVERLTLLLTRRLDEMRFTNKLV